MTLIGEQGQSVREVLFYLIKAVPDLDRGEPRNTGLIIRCAESKKLTYRFPAQPPWGAVPYIDRYNEIIQGWKDAIAKYDSQCLHFIGKRQGNKYANPRLYIELAFTRMVAGRVDFDAVYKRLVSPEGRTHG